jgi:hypothetical protein
MLYVVLTMPTLNKAYLFIYLFIYLPCILLVRVTCEKYRFQRGEANFPSSLSGEGNLPVLEIGIFRK